MTAVWSPQARRDSGEKLGSTSSPIKSSAAPAQKIGPSHTGNLPLPHIVQSNYLDRGRGTDGMHLTDQKLLRSQLSNYFGSLRRGGTLISAGTSLFIHSPDTDVNTLKQTVCALTSYL